MQAQEINLNRIVNETIRARFIEFNNTLEHYTEDSTRFLFREDIEDSPENLDRVRSIMETHTRITDQQLQEVLGLRPATQENIDDTTWILYMRSWTISPNTMSRLLAEWEDMHEFPETEGWLNLAREFDNEPMHLRYVGIVTGRAAIERHEEDCNQAYGILGRFLNGLQAIDQAAFDGARIYEFARRNTTETPTHVRELMERIGIAFFGVERVLNVQHGGYLNTYEPDIATIRVLQSYGAGFFGDFRRQALTDDNEYHRLPVANLQPWLDAIQQQCQTMHLPFPQDYRELIQDQGRPCLVHGHTVFVIVGCDVTREDFQHRRRYFGGGRAGTYTQTILARQEQQIEEGFAEYDRDDLALELFPYIDLFPWYKILDTIDAAVRQLSLYMAAVRPLVIATYSSIATSVAFASFIHARGLKEDRTPFLDYVGVPQLAYHLSPEWPGNDNPEPADFDLAVIVVPHIHPGYERYGRRSQLLNKIIELTWLITTLVAEIAVAQTVPRRVHGRRLASRDRAVVMQQTWARVDPESQQLDERLHDALQDLGDLKTEFKSERRLAHDNRPAPDAPLTNATRRALVAAGEAKMRRYERAAGPPRSEERVAQVTRLWRSNFPALHMHIDRTQEQDWREWAVTRLQGTSYLAAAMRHIGAQAHHPLFNALRQYRPPGVDSQDESWLEDDDHLNRAKALWGEDMRQYLDPQFYGPQQQRERAIRRWGDIDPDLYTPRAVLEGMRIHCPETSPALVRWQDGDQVRLLHYHFPRAAIQGEDYEERLMHLRFLQGGLGLDRSSGEEVVHDGTRVIATLGQLQATSDAQHWKRAWLRERERLNPEGPEEHREEVEAVLAMFENVPANRLRNAPGNAAKDSAWDKFRDGNIFQTDALWLLRAYLNQEFPQGGRIHLAPTDQQWLIDNPHWVPEGCVSLRDSFGEFLEAHLHPKRPYWQEKLRKLSLSAKDFPKNIAFLRPGSESRKLRFQYGRSKRQFVVMDITALPQAP